MMRLLLCLSLVAAFAPLQAGRRPSKPRTPKVKTRVVRVRPVHTAKEAEAIAERDTGGIAVSSRRIPLNGATGGWEVDIHMPNGEKGYFCIVDNDTHMVHAKSPIPNPPLAHEKHEK